MCICWKNNAVDPIWNDGDLGFFEERRPKGKKVKVEHLV